MKNFRAAAELLREEMIERRRDLHRHPELAFEEVRTSRMVAHELTELGLEVQTGVGKTGVVGILEGEQDGKTIMVRCDMDALPINEENQVPYCSETPGKMHACGHDGHTTIGLAVAKMLTAERSRIKGRIKFVFQPAEEIASGARAMINDGVLSDPVPEVCLGLHLWNELPVGDVSVPSGAVMTGVDEFDITLHGKGGHGAIPHQTHDPVVAAAQIISAAQTIISRNLNPQEVGVVSFTRVDAGTAHNIIPEYALIQGTIRTYKTEVREKILQRFEPLVKGIATAMNCEADIAMQHLATPVMNDDTVARTLQSVFTQIAPDLNCRDDFRVMAAEDMALFLEKIPGTFFFVGSANDSRGLNFGHHHPRFDFDEEALVIGASLLTSAVAHYVLNE